MSRHQAGMFCQTKVENPYIGLSACIKLHESFARLRDSILLKDYPGYKGIGSLPVQSQSLPVRVKKMLSELCQKLFEKEFAGVFENKELHFLQLSLKYLSDFKIKQNLQKKIELIIQAGVVKFSVYDLKIFSDRLLRVEGASDLDRKLQQGFATYDWLLAEINKVYGILSKGVNHHDKAYIGHVSSLLKTLLEDLENGPVYDFICDKIDRVVATGPVRHQQKEYTCC